jgi:hypothetical protein
VWVTSTRAMWRLYKLSCGYAYYEASVYLNENGIIRKLVREIVLPPERTEIEFSSLRLENDATSSHFALTHCHRSEFANCDSDQFVHSLSDCERIDQITT